MGFTLARPALPTRARSLGGAAVLGLAALGCGIAAAAPAVAAPPEAAPIQAAQAKATEDAKPRVILTNDGEVDDMDSFIRYLYYANEFDTEGIVLTSSMYHWAGNGDDVAPFRWTGTEWISDYIDKYGEIYPNLVKHDADYPSPEELHSIYKIGNISNVHEMEEVTEGSELIVDRILADEPGPLYVLAWGGTNSLARALKSIEEEYSSSPEWPAMQAEISEKVVVYNILTQDNTLANYIKPAWPDVKIIDNQGAFWGFAYFWRNALPADQLDTLRGDWLGPNIVNDHGPLAYEYRTMRDGKPTPGDDQNNRWRPDQNTGFNVYDFLSEGDSPSFMYLLDFNGLRSSEDPTWGGWGGRFDTVSYGWKDAADQSPFVSSCGGGFIDPCKMYAQMRWLDELQNDFAARVDWGIADDYSEANHNPTARVAQGVDITAMPGSTVPLRAIVGDVDGDAVATSWWQYEDADTYAGTVEIVQSGNNGAVRFKVPTDAEPGQTIHLILEATDDGTPALTHYQRVVVTVG
ncbi:nucleoside hydrolase-like domain-containing protein [Demequina silvatica]|uniref:nucleoside hydrolase-like domain-containing protein n=1 Tax=Demequina silvatica TaxID=1638988 RepID=UPI0009E5DFC7|nr:nucleoside hydrolase-like domain-containing protein [Demequina silvatica]